MNPIFELVIFDCDGTLITSEVLNNTAVSKALNHLGYNRYDLDLCLKTFQGKSFKDICKIVETNESSRIDKSLFGNLIKRFSIENIPNIEAVPNAAKVLEQIKLPKVVGSNGHREFVIKYLEQAELLGFFGKENIFTHNDYLRPKPYPDMFLHAAMIYNVDPSKAIVVEDSTTGIRAAKSAGMFAVGFTGAHFNQEDAKQRLVNEGADVVIEDLLELQNYLHV
ncbi:MAG: HAD family phosphatase [Rickettsiales bacterium]|nr:HAD family phosphatase [Rickettsiales bacterium]